MDLFQQDVSQRATGRPGPAQANIGETPDMFGDYACWEASDDAAASVAPDINSDIDSDINSDINDETASSLAARSASSSGSPTLNPGKQAAQRPVKNSRRQKRTRVDHLAAARKLQWQLRRTRSHSPEEVKTGRLICRHLLALLNEANAEPTNHSPVQRSA